MEIIAERKTKTIYRENDKKIKLFVENYSKANILNEALNQARVEETDLNIPKLLEVTKIDNRWALVSEYIVGKSLEQLRVPVVNHIASQSGDNVYYAVIESELERLSDKMDEVAARKISPQDKVIELIYTHLFDFVFRVNTEFFFD